MTVAAVSQYRDKINTDGGHVELAGNIHYVRRVASKIFLVRNISGANNLTNSGNPSNLPSKPRRMTSLTSFRTFLVLACHNGNRDRRLRQGVLNIQLNKFQNLVLKSHIHSALVYERQLFKKHIIYGNIASLRQLRTRPLTALAIGERVYNSETSDITTLVRYRKGPSTLVTEQCGRHPVTEHRNKTCYDVLLRACSERCRYLPVASKRCSGTA
jgi:hypothetical protein